MTSLLRTLTTLILTVALAPGDALLRTSPRERQAQSSQTPAASTAPSKISADQLNSLVAPIALYPDPLLAQTLAASTYPLEIIQLQQWLTKNSELKDKALADAAAKQPWDASVQALAAVPEVVKRLADDIQWTTDLGNAFLAQQGDVMDAVQRMRKEAQDKGHLKSTDQQKVETKVIENKTVIVVEQANPQFVYVPSYNPVVVWGPPVYPYPPIYYPPPGYYAAGLAVSFGVGVMMGAFWSGGWGWGCGWSNNNITINNNNNFNRNSNISGNRNNIGRGDGLGGNRGGQSTWNHNPQHRGGAPYRDRATADRFGGTARGDSLSSRQANARQQLGRQGGNLSSSRGGSSGLAGRSAGNGASSRASGAAGGGGGDRIGSRDVSRGGSGNRDAFGGGSRGSGGYNGASARASGSRGASSLGSRGGGASRGGGRRR